MDDNPFVAIGNYLNLHPVFVGIGMWFVYFGIYKLIGKWVIGGYIVIASLYYIGKVLFFDHDFSGNEMLIIVAIVPIMLWLIAYLPMVILGTLGVVGGGARLGARHDDYD